MGGVSANPLLLSKGLTGSPPSAALNENHETMTTIVNRTDLMTDFIALTLTQIMYELSYRANVNTAH